MCCNFLGSARCREDQILHWFRNGVWFGHAVHASRFETWIFRMLQPCWNEAGVGQGGWGLTQPMANMVHIANRRNDNHFSHDIDGSSGFWCGRGGRGGRFSGNRLVYQVYQATPTTVDSTNQQGQSSQPQQPSFYNTAFANLVQEKGISHNHQYINSPFECNYEGLTGSWYPDSRATNHISNDLKPQY